MARSYKSKKVNKKSHKKTSAKKSSLKTKCRSYLGKKIGINMQELKSGRFANRFQALAVSYSQTKKKYPQCSRYLKRKSPKKSKTSKK
jgi:hypothetical protein